MTITLPESLSDITIGQYIPFYNDVKDHQGTEEYRIVSIESAAKHFCGINSEILYKLPIEQLVQLRNVIDTCFNNWKRSELIKSFTIGDVKFGFIPDMNKIAYGEYLDLVQYTKNTWDNLATIMTILYRPITDESGGKYTIKRYEGTEDTIIELFSDKVTMDIAFGAISFFLNLQVDCLNNILHYSKWVIEKGISKDPHLKEILAQNGVDMQVLQQLQTMTFSNLTL